MNEELIYLKDIPPGKYGHVIKVNKGKLEVYYGYRFLNGDLQLGYPSLVLYGEELMSIIFLFGSIFLHNLANRR